MESLTDLLDFFDEITFISYFTVYPEAENVIEYITKFKNLLLGKENSNLLLLGPKLENTNTSDLPSQVKIYNSIESLAKEL